MKHLLTQEQQTNILCIKVLTDAETHYTNIKRELLVVIYTWDPFHTYLYSHSFTLESDHKPLEMIAVKNLTATPPNVKDYFSIYNNMMLQLETGLAAKCNSHGSLPRLSSIGKRNEIPLDLCMDIAFSNMRWPK